MNTNSTLGMLRLAVMPARDPAYVQLAAEQIQQLPDVVRVRVDAPAHQIEVVYRQPAAGLLREVHAALRLAGSEVVAGKSR